ncbi:MAG: hypothetical protein AABY01_02940 [Nanoarchaeota archaeon]
MKKGVVVVLLILLNAVSVSAFAEMHQTFVSAEDGLFYGHSSIDVENEENLRVAWFIPELNFYYRSGSEDDGDFRVNAYSDIDAPSGEYLVRVTLSNDEGRKVVYRYLTIE